MDGFSGGSAGSICLASLSVLLLSGCLGTAPVKESAAVVVRPAVVTKPAQTFVVRRASVSNPATVRVQSQQRRDSVITRPALAMQQGPWRDNRSPQTQARAADPSVRQQQLLREQYHARYQANLKRQQEIEQGRRLAIQKAKVEQAKKRAERERHIARWQHDQQLALSQQRQQQQRQQQQRQQQQRQAVKPASAVGSQRSVVAKQRAQANRQPAASVAARTTTAVAAAKRPQPVVQRVAQRSSLRAAQQQRPSPPIVRRAAVSPQPEQQYLARWEKLQAEKRLESKRAEQRVESVIHTAKKQIGTKYAWGGTNQETGFDCSGLVQHAMLAGANVKVPRTAAEQYQAAVKVPAAQAERGDLVFFVTQGQSVSHVGLYLGNNRFLHSPRKGLRVTTSELSGYWKKRLVGFGRIPGACKLPV